MRHSPQLFALLRCGPDADTGRGMSRLRLLNLVAAASPVVVGFASYGWMAWLASATGKSCGPAGAPARLSFLPLIMAPTLLVGWRTKTASLSWTTAGLFTLTALVVAAIAVVLGALTWGSDHNCF